MSQPTKRALRLRRMIQKVRSAVGSDTTIDAGAASLGAALGMVSGPGGSVLAAAATVSLANLTRHLTHREERRLVQLTESTALQILQRIAAGSEPRTDVDPEEAKSLVEGILLQARNSYEEKKVPLLANLLATAPFPGTPVANLIAPLALIERLSYRQICLLALIPGYDPNDYPPLTDGTLGDVQAAHPVGEFAEGVLADLTELIRLGLVVPTVNRVIQEIPDGQVRPKFLRLTYPSRLLANGARLRQTIPEADVAEIRDLLSHPTPGERMRHPPIATR